MKKKYKVDITATAEADIAELWDYIAQDNPDAATSFILQLEEQIASLEQYPERCPLIPENEFLDRSYRHLLFGNYRTIFKMIDTQVIILRVIHGARLLALQTATAP
ncbi:MAG TPA: type II toxin-antitoxin system RelE/ParE family toxin [Smithellaceae bacterium]|nr:type II toxin-antitoxin system RelE/ParE family toxin [Syntrophaceae bacterium]NMC90628.1 type II toxin-antitoxin system RelE/ParE family toxin [Smithella sp.]HNV56145.1 type II toxin-antitoxin system RelE/ParE family toxin [Smithellaceae bacterium]MBP8666201.1 type II toxin-antitoxin system RelE/ParE family toxin [Syntrophaceae bacterium]MBP9532656.1 type II toxin-antitoxin system RelE/ParE family toxin [Syntrophaceae bacterium]